MTREELEEKYGQVWTTDELYEDFDISKAVFGGGLIFCTRKSDGKEVSMDFGFSPRVYFNPIETNR